MDPSNQNEEDQVVVHDFSPRFRVYKSGRVERLRVLELVPASSDPDQNVAVLSKDVVVSVETGVSVRIFLPAEARTSSLKLPLLIYAHGGYFCLESAFSSTFHNYVTSLVSQANVIAVSMDYSINLRVLSDQIFLMDPSNQNEEDQVVVHDFSPRFRVYKSGRVERLRVFELVPASSDPDQNAAVLTKDVVVSPETGISVRIFLPAEARRSSLKLPLLIYAHGGAFCLQSAFSSTFHNYVTSLVSQANVIAVSMDYRLAPENPIPACYEDSWAVVQWAAAHQNSNGPDPWLNDHADFSRVFLAGDSAGANIIHNTLIQIGSDPGSNPHPLLKIQGATLVHPFFSNHEPDELLEYLCQDNADIHDPRLNPTTDPNRLGRIPVERVLVCLAGDDHLRGRGVSYHEALKESAWSGDVEVFETEDEDHVFHLFHPNCEKALALLKRVALFLNGSF